MGPRSGTRRKIKPRSIVNYSSSKRFAFVAMKKTYTDKQGQYLAFIYYDSKIHGCSPSEAEMQQYFRVSPPATSDGLRGLIARTPGQGPINPSADLAGRATRLGLEVIANNPRQDFDQPGCQDGLRLTLTFLHRSS
jgi:hypothetical protein